MRGGVKERTIQKLIRSHPYLLDDELLGATGRIERRVRSGRLDIDFLTPQGLVVVECKVTGLKDKDALQLRRYLNDLAREGQTVYRAYLVGDTPAKPLNEDILNEDPPIRVALFVLDFPKYLAFSEGRHYFDGNLDTCPHDGTRRIPGEEIWLDL